MKKILKIFLCLILLFIFNACSGESGEPSSMTEEMYKLGISAMETADDFIDGKITGDEAKKRLENSSMRVESRYKIDLEESGTDTLVGTEYYSDSLVYFYVSFIESSVIDKINGTGTDKDIIDDRNKLAEVLGEKKR